MMMLREYLGTARSQLQSLSRRVFNSIGLIHNNDDSGIPIQNRIFSFFHRKFGSHLKYFIFSSVLFLLYLLSVVAKTEELYANKESKISISKPDLSVRTVPDNYQENKFLRNDSTSTHDNSKNSSINPSFLLSLFFTFLGWLTLINLLRCMRAWIIARTALSLPTAAATSQREAMLMLQRLILQNDSDPSTLPSRLRLAFLQRDFTADDYELLQQLDNNNLPPSHRIATDAQINQLPVHIVTPSEISEGVSEDGNGCRCCNICLAPYEVGDELRTVRCMHSFHKLCIDRWLRMNAVCPVCKNLAVEEV